MRMAQRIMGVIRQPAKRAVPPSCNLARNASRASSHAMRPLPKSDTESAGEELQVREDGRGRGQANGSDRSRARFHGDLDVNPSGNQVPRTRGQRALRHAGRGAGYVVMAAIPLIVLAGLALALGYVRLLHGPISLGVLVGPIERSINAQLEGYVAKVGDAIVMLTDDNRLEFRLRNVSFAEADGDVVASAPLAAIEMSQPALMNAQLAPSRVELIEPRIYATYTAAGGFQLSFSAQGVAPSRDVPGAPAPRPAQRPLNAPGPDAAVDAAAADQAAADTAVTLKRLDVMRLVAETTAETRNSVSTTSYLREFGLSNATLHVENEGRRSVWKVSEVVVDLERRKRQTIISGRAVIDARRGGSWAIAFHTEDKDGQLYLNTQVRDLVPRQLAEAGDALSALAPFDMPLGADVRIGLSRAGEVLGSTVALELGRGRILVPEANGRRSPVPVDAGLIKLSHDPATNEVALEPSTIRWGGGNAVTLAGVARREASETSAGHGAWIFTAQSLGGALAASEFAVGSIPVENWQISGRVLPAEQRLEIGSATLAISGTGIRASGEVSLAPERFGSRFEVSASDVPVETLKALWAPGLAPVTRTWVGANVSAGRVATLNWQIASGAYAGTAPAGTLQPSRADLLIEARDVVFRARPGTAPISAPRAEVRLAGHTLEVTLPQAVVGLASGTRLDVEGVRLHAPDVYVEPADATVSLKGKAPAAAVLELLSTGEGALIDAADLAGRKIGGKVEADLSVSFPMVEDLDAARIRTAGRARLTDGRANNVLGDLDMQGATVDFEFNSGAVEARGEALVKGVPVKISWQRIFDAVAERQPPLRLTATLDDSDRAQLGLDINEFVHGVVPVDVQILQSSESTTAPVHVRADLTSAELSLGAIAWRKPPGRSAFLEFDVVAAGAGRHELRGLRVAGDSIAVGGSAEIGADRRLRAFSLPEFSLNIVTRLKVQGTLGNDNVWKISVKGPTFDGRDFFRTLFVIDGAGDTAARDAGKRGGLDLQANVDTVLGFSDLSLRGMTLAMSRRGGRLTALEARGTLDGGAPLAVELDKDDKGTRRLRADTSDAGQAFKFINFYPNMQGGRARLQVNVDGKGAAEKTGTLWVEDFRVLGDPIVSEVVSSVDDSRPQVASKSGRRVVRQVFEFDAMRVPFSVGHGQLVMDDAYVRGPLVGATIRGKLDYKTERMSLGGTYIPLQGLNNAFGQIPLLGQILSGPRGEGIFGITFAIQGAMSSPQVLVNPLSLVTPGIFREVFQMTGSDPKVQPRTEKTTEKSSQKRRATSASEPAVGEGRPGVPGTSIDGWTSETRRR